MELRARERQ